MSVVGPGAPYTWTYPSAPSGSLIFTVTTTWVVPAGLSKPINIIAIGGGGGGGGGYSTTYTGGGGGSGAIAYAEALVNPGDMLNVQVGVGGSPGTGGASPTAGGNGGGSGVLDANGNGLCYAGGGGGGGAATSSANGANGSGGLVGGVNMQTTSAFGIKGQTGQNTGNVEVPTLPLGSAVSTSNIVTTFYGTLPNSGVGAGGGGVNSNGGGGVAGIVFIWWGD